MVESPTPVESAQPAPKRESGCASLLVPILGGIIALISAITNMIVSYSLEQVIFEGSLPLGVARWQVALFFSIGLCVVTSIFYVITRAPALRVWMAASLFGLLIIPARFAGITQAQLTAMLQIGGMLVFLAFFWLVFRRGVERGPADSTQIAVALFCGLLLATPWALLGALGSPLDTLLQLLTGLLFGLCAAWLLALLLSDAAVRSGWRTGAISLVYAVALLVMVAGLAQNFQQVLLGLLIPVLSRAALSLSLPARDQRATLAPAAILLGLAAAWPLVFVDSDELALVITSGAGELTSWVGTMVSVALSLALAITLALPWLAPMARRTGRLARLVLPLVALALVGLVYALLGQPGFHGERLFVILRDQADVSSAEDVADYNARRSQVFDQLTTHADQTQAAIRAQLDRFGFGYRPYYLVNAIEVDGGPLLRAWLERRPEVERVLNNPVLRPLPTAVPAASGTASAPDAPQWDLTMIGAGRVWQELGVRGAGVIVGQSDSGAQGDHPELADSYRGRAGDNDYNWYDPWNASPAPVDIGGHGTHTLGSVLGNRIGVAPDAEWIGCVNLARNLGNPAVYLDCMQFMLAPFPQGGDPFRDGDPLRGAMILNNSWGCPDVEGCDPTALQPAVRALRAAGIFVVVSAGNSGYSGCGSVKDPPAIYEEVYSVGAVNSMGGLAQFSSVGPVTVDGSNRVKPDIVAPGEGVLSAYPNSSYEYASGTSMAGPHVVGVVALMWSANPALIGDIETTTRILNETARPLDIQTLPQCGAAGEKSNAVGYGLVDAFAAVQAALAVSNP